MAKIELMGHFTAIGMRTPIPTDHPSLTINTCSDNDTDLRGDMSKWSWANPTNRKFRASYREVEAVSTEALWQGTKIIVRAFEPNVPDKLALEGDWRRAKGKRPLGHWGGTGNPLIMNPGDARRAIYIPAFRNQIVRWLADEQVRNYVEAALKFKGNVFLRDFDTGRGIDRNGPMSHAWVLASWLNTGAWPDA